MSYSVVYHDRVAKDDLPSLSRAIQRRVIKAIDSKLINHPQEFGKPLRSPLAPFRSLRVGDHRIVYLVRSEEVIILAVGHRRDIYRVARPRSGD